MTGVMGGWLLPIAESVEILIMQAYEFVTRTSAEGNVTMPDTSHCLPANQLVRVLILVGDEPPVWHFADAEENLPEEPYDGI
jgi:hypothetical protein